MYVLTDHEQVLNNQYRQWIFLFTVLFCKQNNNNNIMYRKICFYVV